MKILISVPDQTLSLFSPGDAPDSPLSLVRQYKISTSKFGLGSEEGSFRTPIGNFLIIEKFGDLAPPGTVFRSRLPTEEKFSPESPEDQITTRILWLHGLEPHNANTQNRFIYIHGTNHEKELGTPTSHGCIRMGNQDIMELFDLISVGTPVTISPDNSDSSQIPSPLV